MEQTKEAMKFRISNLLIVQNSFRLKWIKMKQPNEIQCILNEY